MYLTVADACDGRCLGRKEPDASKWHTTLVRDRSAKELKRMRYTCLVFLLGLVLPAADALAQQAGSLCTMTVQQPAAGPRGQAPPAGGAGAGGGGARAGPAGPNAAAEPAALPKL